MSRSRFDGGYRMAVLFDGEWSYWLCVDHVHPTPEAAQECIRGCEHAAHFSEELAIGCARSRGHPGLVS